WDARAGAGDDRNVVLEAHGRTPLPAIPARSRREKQYSGLARPPSYDSGRLPVLDDELQRQEAVPLVDLGPVRCAQRFRQRFSVAEQDRLEALAAAGQREPRVLGAHRALIEHREHAIEQRRRKALAPDLIAQERRELEGQLAARELAVGVERPREIGWRELLARDDFEQRGEALEVRARERESRGVRVSAEFR